MNSIRAGLKTKILASTGGVVTIIMMAISVTILFTWRSIIIQKQISNSESIARAISVPLIDALIYAEQQDLQKEDVLETTIDNFLAGPQGLHYLSITDDAYRVIAHSDRNEYNKTVQGESARLLQHTQGVCSAIFKDPRYGWVLETCTPLEIGGKRWGVARIGFDAEPIRAELASIFYLLFFLTLAVTLGTLTALYLLVNKITSSITRIGAAIEHMDLDTTAVLDPPSGNDEIALLVRHINNLKIRLQQSRTQLEQVQRQVYQTEKLASIGRLASGVAHEINNPINGIKNCLLAIRREPENLAQTREYLQLVEEGTTYIENIIQKLLGFARQSSRSNTSVDVNDLILQVVRLTNFRIRQKQARLTLALEEQLPHITADGQLIQEVIMNLLINSIDAIPDGGSISIASAPSGTKHISITVTDNGAGIPPSELHTIFEPFFTTKEPGVGTGLGLSVCLGIVGQHGGTITATSTPGIETVFTVILPKDTSNAHSFS